jgi:mRNA-degrading endonuclease RelE of RelBE toxin-antitoxin system
VQFVLSDYFLRQLRKLQKRYRHIKNDIIFTLRDFDQRQCFPLGGNLYKLRCKSSDIKRGKNKSFRLIVFIYRSKDMLVPIVVYFKGDKKGMSKREILYHLGRVLTELGKKF